MNHSQDSMLTNISIDASTAAAGSITGMLVGGPVGAYMGAVISPVLSNLAKRLLGPNELSRMERVVQLGYAIHNKLLESGAKLRKDIPLDNFSELAEGVLLSSRNSYEEKKIPLLANLIAKAPFTNTPIENLNQTLHEAERLTYRQLCLLSIVDKNQYGEFLQLSDNIFNSEKNKQVNELAEGVYQDLNLLIVDGIIAMKSTRIGPTMIASGVQFIKPSSLYTLYPGRLLVNGLGLANIPESDITPLIRILEPSD